MKQILLLQLWDVFKIVELLLDPLDLPEVQVVLVVLVVVFSVMNFPKIVFGVVQTIRMVLVDYVHVYQNRHVHPQIEFLVVNRV